ncbi:MAG: Fic family protein [Deltaproteobacteria bacterium]|nr:Fic family protein [Deltaproteobacteria bacterium]
MRKIGPRLYTSNMVDEPEQLIRQNLWQIVSLLFPGAVVSNRSAIENKISPAGKLYLTAESARTVKLPGLEIVVLKGKPPLKEWDSPMFNFFIACRERAYLENLSHTKQKGEESKNLPQQDLENRLILILKSGGEIGLNKFRDRAKNVSRLLGFETEGGKLDDLIGAIQGTKEADLRSPLSRAYNAGEGYDPNAVERFANLRAALADTIFPDRPSLVDDKQRFYNVAFFDAYFSNFIEGTEFEVNEAIEIIESGTVPLDRPADGHDILGTYRIVGNIGEMTAVPKDYDSFIEMLTRRHSILLEGRPDKQPGQFKEKANQAGMTRFVDPMLVRGTLRQGFEFYRGLEHPFARALAMMFLVAEVHPFNDGNGRVARAMMNAELVSGGMTRIIIPSVFRNEYLSGLKRMSNEGDPTALIRQMGYAQEFVSKIGFDDKDQTISVLKECNAFERPDSIVRLRMPDQ